MDCARRRDSAPRRFPEFRGMKGGWSAPFAPWVLEGWRKHSEALGGPQIVVEVTQRLLNPKETAAVARAHMTPDQLRAATGHGRTPGPALGGWRIPGAAARGRLADRHGAIRRCPDGKARTVFR